MDGGARARSKRSRRLIKKLHRRWLDDLMMDASQASYWRGRLFDSKLGEVFEISRGVTSELPRRVTEAIHQYGLRFSVSTVSPVEADSWLSQGGYVIFKFWATEFPSLTRYSGNNPASR
jgi:hypothetical protein